MSPGQNGWEDSPEEEQEQAWRGDEHPEAEDPYEGWNEEDSGPLYWMYREDLQKRKRDEEDGA